MRIAAIIPTFNEAGSAEQREDLRRALARAQEISDVVVVADGGSSDQTVAAALESKAIVVSAERGRGSQLRHAAFSVLDSGNDVDALVFVHADTMLPSMAGAEIQRALSEGAVGGGFSIRFKNPPWLLGRCGVPLINWRTRTLKVPLGDQAQFARADAYRTIDGHQPWPILEDIDFIRRLGRHGSITVIETPVVTEARRFRQGGVVRTVAVNWLIWTLYFIGCPPGRLSALYRNIR